MGTLDDETAAPLRCWSSTSIELREGLAVAAAPTGRGGTTGDFVGFTSEMNDGFLILWTEISSGQTSISFAKFATRL